jgi:hypothetical protein
VRDGSETLLGFGLCDDFLEGGELLRIPQAALLCDALCNLTLDDTAKASVSALEHAVAPDEEGRAVRTDEVETVDDVGSAELALIVPCGDVGELERGSAKPGSGEHVDGSSVVLGGVHVLFSLSETTLPDAVGVLKSFLEA